MQNIAKASRNRSISELEKVVDEHSQYISSDPIVKVGTKWSQTCGVLWWWSLGWAAKIITRIILISS